MAKMMHLCDGTRLGAVTHVRQIRGWADENIDDQ